MTTVSTTSTRAVVLARRPEGDLEPGHLRVDEIAVPALAPGEALVRNQYMSLDPNARGRMNTGDMVYTGNFALDQPLDGHAVGIVVQSRSEELPVGSTVRHRLGYRELAVVDASTARTVDVSVAPAASWLSALGQTGFTAYVGIQRVGRVHPGSAVFVSAAAGGVGMIAGQVARALGATTVIGSAGGAEKCAWLTGTAGYDLAIDHRSDDVRALLREAVPDGLDLYFDNVGGEQLVAAVQSMRPHSRVALCGMISSIVGGAPQPTLDRLMDLILRRVTVQGFIVRDHEDLRAQFEADVTRWIGSGQLVDHHTVTDGLEAVPAALAGMLRGANTGKALVRLDHAS